jgi:hypothetical protein
VRTRTGIFVCVALEFLSSTSSGQDDNWVFVPVVTASNAPPDPSLARALEQQLGGVGNANAAVRFENSHSSEPVRVNEAKIQELLQTVREGTHALGNGKRKEGEAKTHPPELTGPTRDYFVREHARAQLLFDACAQTAYLFAREQKSELAAAHMEQCVKEFPGYEPSTQLFDTMLRQARERVGHEPHGTVAVQGGRPGCVTRVNGLEIHSSGVDLATGTQRFQLECDPATVGRIHVVNVHRGENKIVLDPRFDASVRSSGALWLAYPDDSARLAHLRADAAELEKILAARVALLVVEPASGGRLAVRVRTVDRPTQDIAVLSFTPGSGYRAADVQAAIHALPTTPQARLDPELDALLATTRPTAATARHASQPAPATEPARATH